MAVIKLNVIAGPTGRLLKKLLEEGGLKINQGNERYDAVICYGVGGVRGDVPTLNAKAGTFNKYEELTQLYRANIVVPDFMRDTALAERVLPVLGRQFRHMQGRDIKFMIDEVEPADFYTKYIPKRKEYRVWAYRRRPLALYLKVKRYEPRAGYRRRPSVVWNWENGYAFDFVKPETRTADEQKILEVGAQAVDALGLDFGAADIIVGRNGKTYVLEVNTSPGVEGPRHGLTALADKMIKWVNLGYPKRKGEERAKQGANNL